MSSLFLLFQVKLGGEGRESEGSLRVGVGWRWGRSRSRRLDLLGEDRDVLVEGVGGTDVSAGHSGFPGSAGRQLALLKDQR